MYYESDEDELEEVECEVKSEKQVEKERKFGHMAK